MGELGHVPGPEEIAAVMDLDLKKVERALVFISTKSLDEPVGGDEDSDCYKDVIADREALDPSKEADRRIVGGIFGELLSSLSKQERAVLEWRFGFRGSALTLEEVGEKFGVTRERIRQIEKAALKKLRHPTKIKQLLGNREARPIIGNGCSASKITRTMGHLKK